MGRTRSFKRRAGAGDESRKRCAALPGTRARGPWAAAIFGGALLAGTVVAAPEAAALPLVAAAWVTAAALAFTPKN